MYLFSCLSVADCKSVHFYLYSSGWDLYCSPCRLYGPTYRSFPHVPLEEVMWQPGEEVIQITSSGGYLDNLLGRLCEF